MTGAEPAGPEPGAPRPGAPQPGAPEPGAPEPGAPEPGAPGEASEAAPQQLDRHAPSEVVLCCLLALAVLYTLYFAKTLLMPIVVALLFALLLSPLVSTLQRFHVPRSVSSVVLLACIGGPLALLGVELADPAQKWLKRLPEMGMQLTEELDAFTESITPKQEAAAPAAPSAEDEDQGFSFFGLFGGDDEKPEAPPSEPEQERQGALTQRLLEGGMELMVSVLEATPMVIVQLLTFAILVLFQLIFGQRLWQGAIEVMPRVRDRRQASLLVGRVQRALSRYILTVSLINAGLGIVTAGVLWLLQVDDALLWGVLVGLFNFAPYVGPLVSLGMLTLAGLVQYGLEWAALVPAGVYFLINLAEAQFVTPLVLGHNMRLNPLVLMLWLIVWGWLWGAAGVLLAVPLLVCLKLAAQQLGVMDFWVQVIETRA